MASKQKAEAQTDSGIVEVPPEGAEGEGGAPEASGKLALLKNRKVMLGGAAALILIAGGGGAALFLGGGHEKAAAENQTEASESDTEAQASADEKSGEEGKDGELPLVDVPAMVVNMRTSDGQSRYLRLRFMLEATSAAKAETLKTKLPAIIDAYQPFLREMRPEDISGSAAVFRIKEELLVRATDIAGRGTVRDVLIQDLVQQ